MICLQQFVVIDVGKDLTKILDLIGRISISAVFLLSGFNKIRNYEGTVGWMESFSLNGYLLIPAIILEIVAPIIILYSLQIHEILISYDLIIYVSVS